MGRFMDRVRDECANGLRRELVGVHQAMERSWNVALDEFRREIDERQEMARADELVEGDRLAGALDRLAGALEGFAGALDVERRQRVVQIELVEFLLREIILGGAPPAPGRPKVVGGSIDAHQLGGDGGEQRIDLRELEKLDSDAEVTVGTPVEVRSRFHDRWSNGFRIAEVVDGPGGRRFKLRRSDGSPLPVLVEATDVRRQDAPGSAPPAATADPELPAWDVRRP